MSAPQRSETESPGPAPNRGVWGFMKRKVWGDVPSHPISDSGSESHCAGSPEPPDLDVSSSHDTTTPKAGSSPAEPRPHSPFQSHIQARHEDDSDEDSNSDRSATVTSASNRMASEPSLRHGLGEGMQCSGQTGATMSFCIAFNRKLPAAWMCCCSGSHRNDTQPADPMNRLPSLAAGISGSGFEWNPSPANRSLPDPPTLNTDSNLTFSSSLPLSNSSNSLAQAARAEGSDIFSSWHDLDEARAESAPHDAMTEEVEEGPSNLDYSNKEQDEGAQSVFSAMQTKAPGLTPLRLTPKTEPVKPRSAFLPFPGASVHTYCGSDLFLMDQPLSHEQPNHHQLQLIVTSAKSHQSIYISAHAQPCKRNFQPVA